MSTFTHDTSCLPFGLVVLWSQGARGHRYVARCKKCSKAVATGELQHDVKLERLMIESDHRHQGGKTGRCCGSEGSTMLA